MKCEGCKSSYSREEYENHVENCEGIKVKCKKCSL